MHDTHSPVLNSANHGVALSRAQHCCAMHYVWVLDTKHSFNFKMQNTKYSPILILQKLGSICAVAFD